MKKNKEPMMPMMKPRLHLDFETLPEAKKWRVGKKYKIPLEVKQTDMDEHMAGFEVMSAHSKGQMEGKVKRSAM